MVNYIYPIQNIDIFFSSKCDLNCSYCYVGKESKRYNPYNDNIKQSIINGSFAKNIISSFKEFKEDIISIGCWGGEPTLNNNVFYILFKDLLQYFHNTTYILFSTNGYSGIKNLKPFIDNTIKLSDEVDRNITLQIQFSLDGPDYITDNQRGLGVTAHVVNTFEDIIKYISSIKHDNASFKFHLKPTLSMDIVKKLTCDENLLYEYFQFFDNIWENNKNNVIGDNFEVDFKAMPTLVSPAQQTQENGIIFSKFIHMISELDENMFMNYKHPFFVQGFNNLRCILNKTQHFDFLNTLGSCACGAGLGSYSTDIYGNIYPCHRYFSESVILHEDKRRTCEKYTTILDDDKNNKINKIKTINAMYENNSKSRKAFFDIIVMALARYGQIEKDYLVNSEKRSVLFYIIGEFLCHYGRSEETKDLFIESTDYIKLFGNGALEELIKYGVKTGEIKYDDI